MSNCSPEPSRRRVLGLLVAASGLLVGTGALRALAAMPAAQPRPVHPAPRQSGDDWVIVDGWVLKRSDIGAAHAA